MTNIAFYWMKSTRSIAVIFMLAIVLTALILNKLDGKDVMGLAGIVLGGYFSRGNSKEETSGLNDPTQK